MGSGQFWFMKGDKHTEEGWTNSIEDAMDVLMTHWSKHQPLFPDARVKKFDEYMHKTRLMAGTGGVVSGTGGVVVGDRTTAFPRFEANGIPAPELIKSDRRRADADECWDLYCISTFQNQLTR